MSERHSHIFFSPSKCKKKKFLHPTKNKKGSSWRKEREMCQVRVISKQAFEEVGFAWHVETVFCQHIHTGIRHVNGCHSGFGRNLRCGENKTCREACDGGVEQPAPSLSLAAGQEAQVNVGVKWRYAAARVFVSVPAASDVLGCGGWSYFRCRVVT